MHNRTVQIVVAVVVVLLAGAVAWSLLSGPGRPRQLPDGPQTLTGTLVPAELSLTRRGTHVIEVNGKDVAYAESASVNLRLYELTDVGVTGTFRLNTDPSDLPVLVVTSVRPIEIPAVTVDAPSVGLTLRVPTEWSMQSFDDGVAFSLTGSATPLLRVARSSLTRLPQGTSMFVAGYDAVRVDGPDGGQTVHLQTGRGVITFTWTPDDDAQTPAFAQLLRTLAVRSGPSSLPGTSSGIVLPPPSSSADAGSAASAVAGPRPCGGPAGVLCPAGTYCAVNSPDGVGTCQPL
jgi:hypothetical protein